MIDLHVCVVLNGNFMLAREFVGDVICPAPLGHTSCSFSST